MPERQGVGQQVLQALKERCRSCADDNGNALIEMALVLPMLMLMLTAVCSFGIMLTNYISLTDAVSTGARQLSISRQQTTDPCAITVSSVQAAAPQLKAASMTFTLVLNGTTYSGTSCSSSSNTTGAAGNLVQGGTAQVTVTYPCNLAVYGKNFAPSCTLVAQTTELVQ